MVTTSPFYNQARGEEYINSGCEVTMTQNMSHPSLTERDNGDGHKNNAAFGLTTKFYEKLNPYYKLQSSIDETLIFESRFESGNLRRAIQLDKFEYELYLKSDYGTNNSTQWYYFRV